jgi:hypothetical protein
MKSRKIQRLEFVSDKIEARDYKRVSCASILVKPRRKMSLSEALHGRRPWPELELHGGPSGARRRGRGRGSEVQLGARGMGRGSRRGAMGRACMHCFPARAAATCSLLVVHEKQEGGRRNEMKKKEGKENRKKEKNMENFPNLKISEK